MFGIRNKKLEMTPKAENEAKSASDPSSSISPEILQEIRTISFLARKRASEGLFGQYRSAFKGQGIEFEELRAYVPGDDVRSIHWGATARSQTPQIKRYREERELEVILAIDVSASGRSGTGQQLRKTLLAQLGATLASIALNNNDKIGLLTYSDNVETFLPPRKSRGSTWRIIHEILYPNDPPAKTTSIANMCAYLSSVLKRRTVVFLLSDFIDTDYSEPLAILARRHDVSAFVVSDKSEQEIPSVGLFRMYNPETGEEILFDSSDSLARDSYLTKNKTFRDAQAREFEQLGIKHVSIQTNQAFVQELKKFFDAKGRKVH